MISRIFCGNIIHVQLLIGPSGARGIFTTVFDMDEMDCDTCFDAPPEFIRPPPSFFCDSSFDDKFSCANDIPFPFPFNTSGSYEPTLAVALVCAVIFSILLTVSGICLWRHKKQLRRYLTSVARSPSSTPRKNSPSAASTTDESDVAPSYADNLDYHKKKALLCSSISPPSGVKFLTDSAIRYAPHHQQPHLTSDGHIYEEIPNNYPGCMTPLYCHAAAVHPRYAVYKDGATLSQQAFIQRQSWLDLLQRPPCSDTTFNLYDESAKASACPNCYYPSLPLDSLRMEHGEGTVGRVTVNPTETAINRREKRRLPRTSPYQCANFIPEENLTDAQTFADSSLYRNECAVVRNNLNGSSQNYGERTRTLESNRSHRPHRKHQKCTNRSSAGSRRMDNVMRDGLTGRIGSKNDLHLDMGTPEGISRVNHV